VTDWMRSDFKPCPASPSTREEELRFVMVKDVRVMTGALRRVDDERWEVIYRADASLYSACNVAGCVDFAGQDPIAETGSDIFPPVSRFVLETRTVAQANLIRYARAPPLVSIRTRANYGFRSSVRSAGTDTWSCTTSHTPLIRLKHAVQRTDRSVMWPLANVPLTWLRL
jgi:hypothetical protein